LDIDIWGCVSDVSFVHICILEFEYFLVFIMII
jgi:hypothetical protein